MKVDEEFKNIEKVYDLKTNCWTTGVIFINSLRIINQSPNHIVPRKNNIKCMDFSFKIEKVSFMELSI